MNDLEKLKELLYSFGIVHEITVDPNKERIWLSIEAKSCDKVEGYSGFYTHFTFDKDGNFLKMGIWE
jgi:hypothetical protein